MNTGSDSIFIGCRAGNCNTGDSNIFIGAVLDMIILVVLLIYSLEKCR